MKDFLKKATVGLTTGGLLVQLLTVSAMGAITVNITGNGTSSSNTVGVTQDTTTVVTQTNDATVDNTVTSTANTGDNTASRNTGGTTTVTTGTATAETDVVNDVNQNYAEITCATCPADVTASITNNGSSAIDDVTVGLTNTTFVTQDNLAVVTNDITTDASSGGNTADDNTGGNTSINTSAASASADVINTVNGNEVLQTGSTGDGLDLTISGNGSFSTNTLDITLDNTLVIDQVNDATVTDTLDVTAETGDNDASRNTDGTVSVTTGDATAGASVDSEINFNIADVSDCCVLDGTVTVSANGSSAVNDVILDLTNIVSPTQDSVYAQTDTLTVDTLTGDNVADDNTDGSVSVATGDALNDALVTNIANSNTYVN